MANSRFPGCVLADGVDTPDVEKFPHIAEFISRNFEVWEEDDKFGYSFTD